MNGSTDAPDATRAAGMEAARAFVDDATVTQRYAHVGSDGDLLLILMADLSRHNNKGPIWRMSPLTVTTLLIGQQ
jgi:hypothetical protein